MRSCHYILSTRFFAPFSNVSASPNRLLLHREHATGQRGEFMLYSVNCVLSFWVFREGKKVNTLFCIFQADLIMTVWGSLVEDFSTETNDRKSPPPPPNHTQPCKPVSVVIFLEKQNLWREARFESQTTAKLQHFLEFSSHPNIASAFVNSL